ncbi:DNA primase [Ligilactobacillus ruminis DPC 6832]|uniref:DNA primase n=1 Tax=Ligilactobacillus ruminis DPC 6832 TaxID=1402208 RepID=A0A837DYI7_9LACO|nr:phage/plasmid primase, P4 family [Ligilactobacillus ruminis]KIC05205.1 DNA primase [Ligilactobacillus ruminis DPC 6832]
MEEMNLNENKNNGNMADETIEITNATATKKAQKKEASRAERASQLRLTKTFNTINNSVNKAECQEDTSKNSQNNVFDRAQAKSHYMEQVTEGHTEKYISNHASELERNAERLTDAAEGSFKADQKMNAFLNGRKLNELEFMNEIKLYLINYSAKWHFEHVNEKTGEPKRMHFTTIADILKKVLHIAIVKMTAESTRDESKLMYWNPETGLYEESEATLNALARICEECITTGEQHQVIGALKDTVELKTVNDWKDVVTCGNGYFRRGELYDYSHDVVFVSKLATDYNADATECPTINGWNFDNWIENEVCHGDAGKINAFWQIIIRVVRYREQNDVMFWLYSEQGGKGKSTFLDLLINLVGARYTGSLTVKQFAEPFKLASAYNKSLIIGDDNPVNALMGDVEAFKSAVTGGLVNINPKNQKPFSARVQAAIIQASNGFPKFNAYDDGVARRFIPLEFNPTYAKPDKRVQTEYIKDHRVLEYILHEALRLDKNDNFKSLPEVVAAKKEIEENSSPVASFAAECLPEIHSRVVPTEFMFACFQRYLEEENRPKTMTRRTFNQKLNSLIKQGKVKGWESIRNSRLTDWNYDQDRVLLERGNGHYEYNDHEQSGSSKQAKCFIRE